MERRNSAHSDALRAVPKFVAGCRVWVCNTAATIRGAKTDTDAKVLIAKLSLNWTGPYKVLAAGPCPCTPADTTDGSLLGDKLLYLDLPSNMLGAGARRRVSVQRCKPCANPHDHGDMSKYLPAGLTQYVLNNFSKKFPPVPLHSRRRSDSSSTTRSGEDHRTPIGSRSRWGHRGDVRDALDGYLWTVLEAGNGPLSSLTRVTKSYLSALGTTQISSYFTKH